MPELSILDVGHGNCAVLKDGSHAIVIDAGSGNTMVEFLRYHWITQVDAIFLSHADRDHLLGILPLLLAQERAGVAIRHIYVNPDTRDTVVWKTFRDSAARARVRFGTEVHVELTTNQKQDIGSASVRVLAPTPEIAMGGVGGRDLDGHKMTANSLSAVVLVCAGEFPIAVFPGDLDPRGLQRLLRTELPAGTPQIEETVGQARILVFPHHGGIPSGSSAHELARTWCEAVKPDTVIFSMGRTKYDNPRPEIVSGVRAAVPHARLMCTELSTHCAEQIPARDTSYLSRDPADGKLTGVCCAGTITISIDERGTILAPPYAAYADAKVRTVPNAGCLGPITPGPKRRAMAARAGK